MGADGVGEEYRGSGPSGRRVVKGEGHETTLYRIAERLTVLCRVEAL